MKRSLLLRNKRALISHQLYLRNLWRLLTAGTPASVLKMIWQDKKAARTKEVQPARLRLHLRHAFAHGVKNGSNPRRGELNCLHKGHCWQLLSPSSSTNLLASTCLPLPADQCSLLESFWGYLQSFKSSNWPFALLSEILPRSQLGEQPKICQNILRVF